MKGKPHMLHFAFLLTNPFPHFSIPIFRKQMTNIFIIKVKFRKKGSKMTCTKQLPTLENYRYYPGLFLMPDDYCQET